MRNQRLISNYPRIQQFKLWGPKFRDSGVRSASKNDYVPYSSLECVTTQADGNGYDKRKGNWVLRVVASDGSVSFKVFRSFNKASHERRSLQSRGATVTMKRDA